MSFLVASIIILIIGSAIAVLLKRKLAEAFPLAAVAIILILYLFGLTNISGSLLYGIYAIIIFAIASIVLLIYKQYKHRETFKEIEFFKGSLLYAGLLGLSVFISYGRFLHVWDEFSHWGTIVKHFYFEDALGTVINPNYGLFVPFYVPGVSLFQYFFARFSSNFIEHNLFIAINMLFFCMITPLVSNIFSKKKWITQSILLVMLLVLPTMAEFWFYSTIYVDAILGVLFGLSLLYYFMFGYEKSTYSILLVASTIAITVFTKDVGVLLSIGTVAIILVDMIFFKRKQTIDVIKQSSGLLCKAGKVVMLLLPLLTVAILRFSWDNLVERSEAVVHSNVAESAWYYVYNFFFGVLEPYQILTRYNFVNAMFNAHVASFRMSAVTFSVVFVIVTFLLSFLLYKKKEKWRMAVASLFLAVGLYFYLFALAITYTQFFLEREAVALASYSRYVATYLLAMTFFLLIFLVDNNEKKISNALKIILPKGPMRIKEYLQSSKEVFTISLAACIFLYLFVSAAPAARAAYSISRAEQLFEERSITVSVRRWMPHFYNERPLLIDQGGIGLSLWRVRYELIPYTDLANVVGYDVVSSWSISTEPRYDGDVWTQIFTPEEWELYVINNDFRMIYVYYADEILREKFGHFFVDGAQSDMVYRVYVDNGNMTLVPVE